MNEKIKKTALRLLPYLFVALAATCLGKAEKLYQSRGKSLSLQGP